MKKLILILASLFMVFNASCTQKELPKTIDNSDGSISITRIDEDGKAVQFNKKTDNYKDVTIVDCSKVSKNNLVSVSLADYSNKDVYIEFNCDMKVVDKTGATNEIIWLVNEVDQNFPQLYKSKVESGKWTSVHSKIFIHLGQNRQLYIPKGKIEKENVSIYIRNFNIKISGDSIGKNAVAPVLWTDAPSLKDTYAPYFDYFGMAISYNQNFTDAKLQAGVKRHLSCMTMENEFKPDFIFGWPRITKLEDFTAEDGKTYKVPAGIPSFAQMDKIMSDAKKLGINIRGHVLVWHSQTPEWFFQTNYGLKGEKTLVSKEEMTARQEWYIKSVLQHVKAWEEKNYNDKRMVFAWDVVNEAASDNSTESNWLRGEKDSKWFAIYQNDEFIVNAFRFANKYAPKEVKLVYNDYGCSSPRKNKAICKIIDSIQSTPGTRIDAVGMQTHVDMNTPVTGANSFESAVKNFLAKGINVQITELDIAHGSASYSPTMMKAKYKEFFEMFLRNRKTPDKKGIEGITIWGVKDEWTWLNGMNKTTQYPLLIKGKDYECKPCFFGVIEAAESAK